MENSIDGINDGNIEQHELSAEINAGVDWWVESIEAGKDSTLVGPVVITGEQLDIFRQTLKRAVASEFSVPYRHGVPKEIILRTDNGPEGILDSAANAARIENTEFVFPQKTIMWIRHGEVAVGFKDDTKIIYKK